jgi:hypothetical protein
MKANIEVELPENWQDISHENPEGPPTFIRSSEDAAGVLQMSIQSLYESGPVPDPTYNDLIRLSEHVANLQEAELFERYRDDCHIGKFGCVIGRSAELARIQIWTLTNGRDFILATFLCTDLPSSEETAEAEGIVKTASLIKSNG